jgi:hypothetical protein
LPSTNNAAPLAALAALSMTNQASTPAVSAVNIPRSRCENPSVGQPGEAVNAIRMLFEPGPLRDMVENWEALALATLLRLRREAARAGGNPELNELIEEAAAHVQGGSRPEESAFTDGPTMATRIRMGHRVLSTISTVASFGTALDVTVNELRIELIFPTDDETEAFFRALAG